jgi:phosphatidylserine/phosphatidylglycerophosphate/cardiolipin synthase-like enzyme
MNRKDCQHFRCFFCVVFLCALCVSAVCSAACFSADISAYFSPNGGATDALVRELATAKVSVYVQAYSFTSAPIARALANAAARGVKLGVVLDKSNLTGKYGMADFLVHHGIKPRIDSAHAIAHNKVIIIDEAVVITGSFNFTRAAEERNAENLLVVRDRDLARKYLDNWRKHAAHSAPYEGR